VAQDTFKFPLKRLSVKNLFPRTAASLLAAYLFEGSFGKGGRESIDSDWSTRISSTFHAWISLLQTFSGPSAASMMNMKKKQAKH
jgi:hypothetical protein